MERPAKQQRGIRSGRLVLKARKEITLDPAFLLAFRTRKSKAPSWFSLQRLHLQHMRDTSCDTHPTREHGPRRGSRFRGVPCRPKRRSRRSETVVTKGNSKSPVVFSTSLRYDTRLFTRPNRVPSHERKQETKPQLGAREARHLEHTDARSKRHKLAPW